MNFKKIFFSIIIFTIFSSLTFFFIDKFTNLKVEANKEYQNKIKEKKITKTIKEYLTKKGFDLSLKQEDLLNIYWAERVKDGGLILLFRHSEREKWNNSVEAFDTIELKNNLDARTTSWQSATCLTKKGVEESKLIGEAFKHAKIKIGLVASSPSCRAKETALYAFNKIDYFFNGLLHYSAFHPSDRKKIGIQLKKAILNLNEEKSSNIILSAHNKVISYYNLIDKMEVEEGLQESGFYIIEKKQKKLIARYKFSKIKNFITLLYRHDFKITKP